MKNFSAVSYQTGFQALTAKQTLVSIKLGNNANSIGRKSLFLDLNIILNVATNIAVLFTVHYKPAVVYKLP
jgi:hypothetical protein